MGENYSDRARRGAATGGAAPLAVAEPSTILVRDLIAQLLPGYDPEKLVRALVAERDSAHGTEPEMAQYNSDEEIAMRELRRARSQLALGEAARTLQHAFNNPLTALLAEAQLLELEPLGDDHRAAVLRILALSRRLVALSRRLTAAEAENRIG